MFTSIYITSVRRVIAVHHYNSNFLTPSKLAVGEASSEIWFPAQIQPLHRLTGRSEMSSCLILDERSENRVLNQERKMEETKGTSDDFCTRQRTVRNIYQKW